MAMTLALNQWSLWREISAGSVTIEDFLHGAAERGFRAVELLDHRFDESPAAVASVRALCDRLGLSVCAYGVRNDFATLIFAEQIRQGDRIRAGLATAKALGAPLLRVFGGRAAEGVSFEESEARLIQGLYMAIDRAIPMGIRLGLENFGQLCGETAQILELINAIGHPSLGVTIDLGNFLLVDEIPAESIARMGQHILHVHLNDFKPTNEPGDERTVLTSKSGRHYRGTVVGEGTVEIDSVLEVLRRQGYSGHLSLEYQGDLSGWKGVDASLRSLEKRVPIGA